MSLLQKYENQCRTCVHWMHSALEGGEYGPRCACPCFGQQPPGHSFRTYSAYNRCDCTCWAPDLGAITELEHSGEPT